MSERALTSVFKSENYEISRATFGIQATNNAASCIFVSFPMRDECNRRFGEVLFNKYRIDVIFVTCKDGSWFQYNDTHLAAAAIRVAVSNYDRVITYGTSMGGYGAISFSAMVGATQIISCSPQYSIDPGKTPFEFRYRKDSKRVAERDGFVCDNLAEQLSTTAAYMVVFDPFDTQDKQHMKLIEQYRAPIRLIVPFSGHKSLIVLREMGLASDLVTSAAKGKLSSSTMRLNIRNRRRQSATYLRFVARALHASKRRGVLELLQAAATVQGGDNWDGLRTDVRLALEYSGYNFAIMQFCKLIKIKGYVERDMFVTDSFRWALLFVKSGAQSVVISRLIEERDSAPVSSRHNLHFVLAIFYAFQDDVALIREHLAQAEGLIHANRFPVEVAGLLSRIGDDRGAIAVMMEAFSKDTTDARLSNLLSDKLFRLEKVKEALEVLLVAASVISLPALPHRQRLAKLLELSGRFDEAIEQADIILQQHPGHPVANRLRGSSLFMLNRYEEACAAFLEAINVPGHTAVAAAGLARCLIAMRQFTEAQDTISLGLQADPASNALLRLASIVELEIS